MKDLYEEFLAEKEHIEKTLDVLREALERSDKTVVELSAIGACIHHCYSGMENIIKRLLKSKRISIPESSSSHKDLLAEAARQEIVSMKLLNKLDKFRGFRHFFVHAYGFMLEENELFPLAMELPEVWNQFLDEIQCAIELSG